MKPGRKLLPNEIEANGVELLTTVERLRENGCVVSSIERVKGSNAGWIVRWFKSSNLRVEGAEFPKEKQEEFFPDPIPDSSR